MTDTISPLGSTNRETRGSPGDMGTESVPRASLQELQSRAVMGELAEAVAHDFNNIVSATLIHLSLLLQDPQLNAGQKESLKTLEQETMRAAGLTRQLLSFSRRRFASKSETIDLNLLLRGIEKMLQRLVRENVALTFEPTPEACWIEADVGQMEKLVMSLCLALRDGMPRGGSLILKTSVGGIDPKSPRSSAAQGGKFVCLALTEIASDVKSGPRTRPVPADRESEPGGWKLDTARQIAQSHHGWLEIAGQKGALEFRVHLPAARARGAENAGAPVEVRGGSETILIVEDEDFLRRVSTLSLRKLGYAVLDAADSDAALKLWEKHRGKIDLLLTDLILPGAESGYDLGRLFTSQKPALRVMLCSGSYAELDEYADPAGASFFHAVKPYTGSRLAQMVRECLDASS
jgi:CheY-like chemotaxis protein